MKAVIRAFAELFLNLHPCQTGKQEPLAQEAAKPMVLIIDDDTALLDGLRGAVRAAGFNVLVAASAAKGLEMLRLATTPVGLVVLDFRMPVLNGAETLGHLRKLSPQTKVIGLTGVTEDDLPETFTRGVDQLIAKPCTNLQLVEAIYHLLDTTPAAGHA